MHARKYDCRVIQVKWLTPTVLQIRFEPQKRFFFEPGQFLSLVVPPATRVGNPVKRCYSFANSYEQAQREGYELCVKVVSDGSGSSYLRGLQPGDLFRVYAPYGDLRLKSTSKERNLCFISTSSGIASFRAMIHSKRFQMNRPRKTVSIFGARHEDEILYQNELEKAGIETVAAISRASDTYSGFRGRVTDYCNSLPANWEWHSTDFYLCGNAKMLEEVSRLLTAGRGVDPKRIHAEAFTVTPPRSVPKAPLLLSLVPAWFRKY